VILTDHLWVPANLGSKVSGNIQKVWLWNNPRMPLLRSIMMQHRRPSARKRVTFTEEVITGTSTAPSYGNPFMHGALEIKRYRIMCFGMLISCMITLLGLDRWVIILPYLLLTNW